MEGIEAEDKHRDVNVVKEGKEEGGGKKQNKESGNGEVEKDMKKDGEVLKNIDKDGKECKHDEDVKQEGNDDGGGGEDGGDKKGTNETGTEGTAAAQGKEEKSDPFAYTKREEFTSENFKIELRGLPKHYSVAVSEFCTMFFGSCVQDAFIDFVLNAELNINTQQVDWKEDVCV